MKKNILKSNGGLYVHVPFCKHKCLYCDFYTGGVRIADWNKFINCLIREMGNRLEELSFNPTTLYIGGGTPSLIPPDKLEKLINAIDKIICVSNWSEFTIEVNPEDVSTNSTLSWKSLGVNRISMGIQSLNNSELKAIGRKHDAETAMNALNILQKYFENISVDIIFGLPLQTTNSLNNTLKKIITFKPSHISIYSLMLEDKTALSLLVKNKIIDLPTEEEWLNMYKISNEYLKKNGYLKYELSNYALSGSESIHNTSYWEGLPYIGLGPGAHSYDGKSKRKANKNDIKGYYHHFANNSVLSPKNQFYEEEILGQNELREEMIMTRLRTVKGLNIDEFFNFFGQKEEKLLLQKCQKYLNSGHMKKESNFLSLAEKGFLIYNTIISDII